MEMVALAGGPWVLGGGFQGTFSLIYLYPGGSVLHSGSSLWFSIISVSCLLVIIHLWVWAIGDV